MKIFTERHFKLVNNTFGRRYATCVLVWNLEENNFSQFVC